MVAVGFNPRLIGARRYCAVAVVKPQVTLGPLVQASRTTYCVPGFSGALGSSVGLP